MPDPRKADQFIRGIRATNIFFSFALPLRNERTLLLISSGQYFELKDCTSDENRPASKIAASKIK
jgi:hypothetical protein